MKLKEVLRYLFPGLELWCGNHGQWDTAMWIPYPIVLDSVITCSLMSFSWIFFLPSKTDMAIKCFKHTNFNMLSFTKTVPTLPCQIPRSFAYRYIHPLTVIRSSSDDGSNVDGENTTNTSSRVQPPITPPNSVEIRFKRGSRRRQKQEQDGFTSDGISKKKEPPKEWDSMTLAEKALELYVGEKGALYWLNKFAYASIYIVIGGWILFRFVFPALNLYQLDTPPLAPSALLKG